MLAERHGLTEAGLLRQVIAALLAQEQGKSSGPELFAGSRGGETGQLRLRLHKAEVERIRALAEPSGQSAQGWVVALVRERLDKAVPFAKDELGELREAIRELGAVGRNLNTITHRLLRSDQYDGQALEPQRLAAAVEKMRKAVNATVTRATHRAGGDDGRT